MLQILQPMFYPIQSEQQPILHGRLREFDKHHFEMMKDGAIVSNSGHFNVEINIPALEKLSKSKRGIRPFVDEYVTRDGRKIFLLGEGRRVAPVPRHRHVVPPRVVDVETHALATHVVVGRTCHPAAPQLHVRERTAAGGGFPSLTEIGNILRRGDSGPYVFVVFHHGSGYPAGQISGPARWTLRLNDQVFDTINLDEQLLIGGSWTDATGGARFDVTDPATGDTVGSVPNATEADVKAAIDAALEQMPLMTTRTPVTTKLSSICDGSENSSKEASQKSMIWPHLVQCRW